VLPIHSKQSTQHATTYQKHEFDRNIMVLLIPVRHQILSISFIGRYVQTPALFAIL
jgi:hypothetical protein